jgi:hypothetical protein
VEFFMKRTALALIVATVVVAPLVGQETKPVPKGSTRVTISGCSKGYVFTAGPRSVESPGSGDVKEGMHLRMNVPKKMMSEIKAHEGALIEITGLMKTGQYGRTGIAVGGVRITPGSNPQSGTVTPAGPAGLPLIDIENWRQVPGSCTVR